MFRGMHGVNCADASPQISQMICVIGGAKPISDIL
jgi:hypothetical protein